MPSLALARYQAALSTHQMRGRLATSTDPRYRDTLVLQTSGDVLEILMLDGNAIKRTT